jgi:hypothetical protein
MPRFFTAFPYAGSQGVPTALLLSGGHCSDVPGAAKATRAVVSWEKEAR